MEEPTQPDFIQQLNAGIRQSIRQFARADRQARQQQALEAGDCQPDDLLTVYQAANLFGVQRRTLYKLIQEGRLKPVRTEPSFLLRRKDVYAYLQTHLPR